MLRWIELEELTYAMQTPQHHAELLREVGFVNVAIDDRSEWYRREAQAEYGRVRTDLYPEMVALMGADQADHFVEAWRALTVVCEKGEMLQVYCRGTKPTDC